MAYTNCERESRNVMDASKKHQDLLWGGPWEGAEKANEGEHIVAWTRLQDETNEEELGEKTTARMEKQAQNVPGRKQRNAIDPREGENFHSTGGASKGLRKKIIVTGKRKSKFFEKKKEKLKSPIKRKRKKAKKAVLKRGRHQR